MTPTIEAEAQHRVANNEALIAAMDAASDERSDFELTIINDAERGRWTAVLGAEEIGELTYRFVGGRVVLLKAWVDHAYREHGVATELIAYALDEIRRSGKKVTVICPVVGEFIARHPGLADLIDAHHPGPGAQPAHPRALPDGADEIAALDEDVR